MNSYKLEEYLDTIQNNTIDSSIYHEYTKFGYEDEKIFKLHFNFMLKHLYDININGGAKKRLGQDEFRKEIEKKFKNKCVITGETCLDELSAAHIVPVHQEENYDIDNGLLLRENLHRTYDKYKWSIDPEKLCVVINKNNNVGDIRNYEGKKVDIVINEKIKRNLDRHYKIFLEKY